MRTRRNNAGFSLVEILIGTTFITFGLLAIAAMFPMSYVHVNEAGQMTMTLTAARQIMEDIRSLPFDDISDLDGFDTESSGTLPAAGAEREIARRWRYALAGEGDGFTYSTAEKARWALLSTAQGVAFGGRGQIDVVQQSATLRLVTITITIPGRERQVQLATIITAI